MGDRNIIQIRSGNDEEEVQNFLNSFSPEDRAEIERMITESPETDQSIRICRRMLKKYPDNDNLLFLLVQYLFIKGDLDEAERILKEVAARNPEDTDVCIALGKIYHRKGKIREAVREFQKAEETQKYTPFYFTSYGESLQLQGNESKARDIFHKELERYRSTGENPSARMLDGAFQRCLWLDISLCHNELRDDIELYKKFLSEIELDEYLMDCLSNTIVGMSRQLENKWFRPVFLDFVDHVRDRGYISAEPYIETIHTAYTSEESWRYHEDRRISAMMESLLSACRAKKDMDFYNTLSEREKKLAPKENYEEDYKTLLAYKCYLCMEYEAHKAETEIIRNEYPATYAVLEDFFTTIKSEQGRKDTEEAILDEICSLVNGYTPDTLREEMKRYAALASKGKKVSVAEGEQQKTIRNPGRKIMPNDPCPCGSGKKYKKCCGLSGGARKSGSNRNK